MNFEFIFYNQMVVEFKNVDDTLFYYISGEPTGKIICFDLDWTLTYGAKHLFPKIPTDIHLIPRRRSKLKYLADREWNFVIFTNQFCRSKKEQLSKIARLTHFLNESEFTFSCFIATKKDVYRKPNIGMWSIAKKLLPNCDFRHYVGDAAGRPQDFADSDRQFALNYNIKFLTPEQVFKPKLPKINHLPKTMVVLIGMPGSGKTTFYNDLLKPHNYTHVNQDTLKTIAAVTKSVVKAITAGESLCIDNLNHKLTKRKTHYDLANDAGYNIITVYFVRDGRGWNDLRDHKVPPIVYHLYFKYLVEPTANNTPGMLYSIC